MHHADREIEVQITQQSKLTDLDKAVAHLLARKTGLKVVTRWLQYSLRKNSSAAVRLELAFINWRFQASAIAQLSAGLHLASQRYDPLFEQHWARKARRDHI